MIIGKIVRKILVCFATMIVAAPVVFSQTASFTYIGSNTGCAPLPVTFVSTVTTDATTGNVKSLEWDFTGSNNFIRVYNDTTFRNYNSEGTYTVILRVTYANGQVVTATGTVEVYSIPAVNFSLSDTTGCVPTTINIAADTAGLQDPVAIWDWDFSTLTNVTGGNTGKPSVTYTTTGQFQISLLVTTTKGCVSKEQIAKNVNIYTPPTPNFIYSGNVCTPGDSITFMNTTDEHGAPVAYEWDFGDGNSSNEKSPKHAFAARGTYTVTLNAKIGSTCSKLYSYDLQIGSPDITSVTATPPMVCTGTNINFKATVAPANFANYYRWTYGDGGSSTNVSPNKAYSSSGDYTVTLVVTNNEGCKDTATVDVKIIDKPAPFPKITVDCSNIIQYTDTVSSYEGTTISYLWTFGDASTSTTKSGSHTYALSGTKTIKLAVNNGLCAGEKTVTAYVGKPEPNFTIKTPAACNSAVTFTVNAGNTGFPSGNTYYWNFGDGSNTRTTTSTSTSYTFPQLTVEKTYEVWLVIKSPGGCLSDTLKQTITRRPIPTATISADTLRSCDTPLNVNFWATTTGLGPLYYAWNFGNGTTLPTLNDNNPNRTYNPARTQGSTYTYNVSVTVSDTAGCTGKSNTLPVVIKIPKLTSSVIVSCLDLIMKVDVTNLFPDDDVIMHKWEIPAFGVTYSGSTASSYFYSFPDGTPRQVTYTATTKLGCTHSITFTVYPDPCLPGTGGDTIPPTDSTGGSANAYPFLYYRSCDAPYTFTFEDTTSSPNIKILSWSMGDGTIFNTQPVPKSVTHTYPSPSSNNKYFVVILLRENTVTHDTTYYYRTIKVVDEKADFTANTNKVCANGSITYTPKNINTENIKQYTWLFKPSSGSTVTRTINNPSGTTSGAITYQHTVQGKYTVSFIIEDIFGCRDTATMQVSVGSPKVSFTVAPSTGCGPELTSLFTSNVTKYDTVGIKEWRWVFGDATVEYGKKDTISHIYHAGANAYYQTFTPSLTITDSAGCTASYSLSNGVRLYIPKASFYTLDTLHCEKYNVTFINESQPTLSSNIKYIWNYGFGSDVTMTQKLNPTVTYPSGDGEYTVRLIVDVNDGCRDTMTRTNYVKFVHPTADFSVSDTLQCAPTPLKFSNHSKYGISYTWDMGDNTGKIVTDVLDTLAHNYGMGGFYEITLDVLGLDGCTDRTTRYTRVRGPSGRLVTSYDKTCLPVLYNMAVVDGLNIAKYYWDFQDGSQPSSNDILSSSVQHWFTTGNYPLYYVPNVILEGLDKNAAGAYCRFELTSKDTIRLDEIHAAFDYMTPNACSDSGYVQFTNRTDTSSPTFYKWFFGDGQTSTEKHPRHLYDTSGQYEVTLIAEAPFSHCIDTIKQTFYLQIHNFPKPTIHGVDSICMMETFTLTSSVIAKGEPVDQYAWYEGNTFLSDSSVLVHHFTTPGMHTIKLITTTTVGCADSTAKTIRVNPLPVTQPSYNDPLCEGSPLQLYLNNSGTQYLWSGPGGYSSTLQNPVRNPSSLAMSGAYTVRVVDAKGCVAYDTLEVDIDKKVGLTKSGDAFICVGESAEIWVNGNTTQFSWTPVDGLNNPNIRNPIATPINTTIYKAVGHSMNSCPDETAMVKVTITDNPTVSFADSVIHALAGDLVTLSPSVSANVYKYQWTPATGLNCLNCREPSFTAQRDITYLVTVTTQYGCKSSASVDVKVSCNQTAIKIPNAFTPNGDGLNDVFRVIGYGIRSIKSLQIFDRLGGMVFSCYNVAPDDPAAAWDGKVRGKEVTSTTGFVYQIELICTDGDIIPFKGELLLIK